MRCPTVVALAVAGAVSACLAMASAALGAPFVPPSALRPADGPALIPAVFGDVPETGQHRRGGRHAGKAKPAVSAGTPKLKSDETPEAAQKQYLKKYGF